VLANVGLWMIHEAEFPISALNILPVSRKTIHLLNVKGIKHGRLVLVGPDDFRE
jgi:hypothetical protein